MITTAKCLFLGYWRAQKSEGGACVSNNLYVQLRVVDFFFFVAVLGDVSSTNYNMITTGLSTSMYLIHSYYV